MSLKFGDKVEIINKPFYAGATGKVIYYDVTDKQFEVLLDGSPFVRSFYESNLKKVAAKRRGVKK